MPRIVIDNTPAVADFNDGSPLQNGMANLANSLIQTPLQVAQIRRQQQSDQMAQLWKQRDFDRQTSNDQMQALWHTQDHDLATSEADRRFERDLIAAAERQAAFDASNAHFDRSEKRLEGDSARQWMGTLGQGAMNIGKVFGLGGHAAARNAGTGWHQSSDGRFFRTSADGVLEVFDPETKQVQRMDGSQPPAAAPAAPAAAGPTGFWDMHRSGQPGGPKTIGDLFGGRWFGQGDFADGAAPAPAAAPAAPTDVTAYAPQSGDPSLAPRHAAPKVVDAQTLLAYATKHRMDVAAAADYLTKQGYTVQAPAR